MKTQSPDTSLDAELVLLAMIRKASVSKRFAFVQAWATSLLEAGSQFIRQQHPQASDEEARLLFMEQHYGKHLTDEIRQSLHASHVHVAATSEYQRALRPLSTICENLMSPYALAGSLASSLYGLQRATLTIDILSDLHLKQLPSFCAQLSGVYLFHQEEIEKAIRQQTCFSLVHLESLLTVTITLPGMLVTGQHVFQRAREMVLVEEEPSILVLSPEQLLLLLLGAFKRSNERADDLWYDLLGVVKIQGTDLDLPFLLQQTTRLGVAELFIRALVDAGLREA